MSTCYCDLLNSRNTLGPSSEQAAEEHHYTIDVQSSNSTTSCPFAQQRVNQIHERNSAEGDSPCVNEKWSRTLLMCCVSGEELWSMLALQLGNVRGRGRDEVKAGAFASRYPLLWSLLSPPLSSIATQLSIARGISSVLTETKAGGGVLERALLLPHWEGAQAFETVLLITYDNTAASPLLMQQHTAGTLNTLIHTARTIVPGVSTIHAEMPHPWWVEGLAGKGKRKRGVDNNNGFLGQEEPDEVAVSISAAFGDLAAKNQCRQGYDAMRTRSGCLCTLHHTVPPLDPTSFTASKKAAKKKPSAATSPTTATAKKTDKASKATATPFVSQKSTVTALATATALLEPTGEMLQSTAMMSVLTGLQGEDQDGVEPADIEGDDQDQADVSPGQHQPSGAIALRPPPFVRHSGSTDDFAGNSGASNVASTAAPPAISATLVPDVDEQSRGPADHAAEQQHTTPSPGGTNRGLLVLVQGREAVAKLKEGDTIRWLRSAAIKWNRLHQEEAVEDSDDDGTTNLQFRNSRGRVIILVASPDGPTVVGLMLRHWGTLRPHCENCRTPPLFACGMSTENDRTDFSEQERTEEARFMVEYCMERHGLHPEHTVITTLGTEAVNCDELRRRTNIHHCGPALDQEFLGETAKKLEPLMQQQRRRDAIAGYDDLVQTILGQGITPQIAMEVGSQGRIRHGAVLLATSPVAGHSKIQDKHSGSPAGEVKKNFDGRLTITQEEKHAAWDAVISRYGKPMVFSGRDTNKRGMIDGFGVSMCRGGRTFFISGRIKQKYFAESRISPLGILVPSAANGQPKQRVVILSCSCTCSKAVRGAQAAALLAAGGGDGHNEDKVRVGAAGYEPPARICHHIVALLHRFYKFFIIMEGAQSTDEDLVMSPQPMVETDKLNGSAPPPAASRPLIGVESPAPVQESIVHRQVPVVKKRKGRGVKHGVSPVEDPGKK